MVPETLVGLVAFVVAVSPGYVFTRVAERRGVRPNRSQLLEAAELVVAGTLATSMATLLVFALGAQWHAAFLDLTDWAKGGDAYLRDHADVAGRSIALAYAVSLTLAATAALLWYRNKPASFFPAGTVWGDVFDRYADGRSVFVSVLLQSGDVVEGYRLSYGNTLEEQRELALAGPVFFTPKGGTRVKLDAVHATIIPADDVRRIGVRYEQF